MALGEAKAILESKYNVRISDTALRALDSKLIPEDKSAEEVLEMACELVIKKFRNYGHELDLKFNDMAYELRHAIVELVELYRSDHPDSKSWVARLRSGRDSASNYMNWLLCVSDFGLDGTLYFQETIKKITLLSESILEENSSDTPFKEASEVFRFLDDVTDQLIYRFRLILTVMDCHVAEVLSKLTDVPLTHIDPSATDYHKKIAINWTNVRVVNQGPVINEIFETLTAERPITITRRRPRGSFLLLGSSGVGKTEIAKAVARHWYCDESRLVEIDMAEYIVEPPMESAEGAKSMRRDFWNKLAKVVIKRPYSVIILDKIEKASLIVLSVLLEVLSCYESASDIDGKNVDFSKSIIFMTSDVGIDQLELPCTCYKQQYNDLPKHSRPSRMKFEKAHRCPLKYNGPERVINEARKTLSADLLDSLDKVLVVKRFINQRAVGRLILRETVRDAYGERFVVHASNEAIDALYLKAWALNLEAGKRFRPAFLEHVIPQLPATKDLLNVYVDTLVGTRELSFRFQTQRQHVGDCYFKLKDGSFDKFMAELKGRVEAAERLIDLRSECLRLFQSGGSLYELKKLVLDAHDDLLMLSKYQDIDTLLCYPVEEVASCIDNLPTFEEKQKLIWLCRKLEKNEKNETGIGKATRSIMDALVEMSDEDSLESRTLPPRHYFFIGLNSDAKAGLISCLNEFLGESFFVYVKLDSNCRGEEVKKFLVDQVRHRPCLVVMFDGVEFADDALYKSLLEILDKGTMEDESVEFRRMILILTSDADNKQGISMFPIFDHKPVIISDIDMNRNQNVKKFRTELLYRVEKIIVFDPDSEHGGVPLIREHGVRYEKPLDALWLCRFLGAVFK